jgi:hypothetical protein
MANSRIAHYRRHNTLRRNFRRLNMKSVVSTVDLPDRTEVVEKLTTLIEGGGSPDEVSRWASTWLLADQIPGTAVRVVDWPVWEAIKRMAGADLQAQPGSYLHGTEDFRAWLAELRTAPHPSEPSTSPRSA